MQYPEAPRYHFLYHDGSPACFADVAVWAQQPSGRKIPVFGGAPVLQTDGNGSLPRISNQSNWVSPEVHLIDRVAGRSAKFPLYASEYTLDWNRPAPFAEFDGQEFADVDDYLDYLATRYSFLTNMTPTPLSFSLNRVGSPPPSPKAGGIFLQLQEALGRANGNFLLDPNAPDINQEMDDEHLLPGRRVLWALSGLIPVAVRTHGRHTRNTMAAAYLQMLQRIAAARKSLPLPRILSALSHALPHGLKKDEGVLNELEDWALVGLLVFLAGLNAFGYVFANFDEENASWLDTFAVIMVLPKP